MLTQILSGNNLAALTQRLSALPDNEWPAQQLVEAVEAHLKANPEALVFDAEGFAHLNTPERSYAAGRFTTPTLGMLKSSLAQGLKAGVRHQARVSVMQGTGLLNDIKVLQGEAEADTLYQLASQFNCLEATWPCVVPVSHYFGDGTQGPISALSAFPGVLLRHYAAPEQSTRFEQSTARSLNLLADAVSPELARVTAGYLRTQDIADPEALREALTTHFDQIRIGLHEDIEVTFGAKWSSVPAGTRKITQAMSSTLALGGYSQHSIGSQEVYQEIMRQLLRATYLGVLLGAAAAGKSRVLLTAIGGGVFQNPQLLIWESILWAATEAENWLPHELEIILNAWSFHVPESQLRADCQARGGQYLSLN